MKIPTQIDEETRGPEHFDKTAEQWDSYYEDSNARGRNLRMRLQVVVGLLGDGPGELLDIGAGSGRLLAAASERGWTVHGIDAAPRMLELAATRLPSASGRLTLGSAENLPFEAERFDAVAAMGVLEWVQTIAALQEMSRVLRRGGRAVICIRNGRAPGIAWRYGVTVPIARRVKRVVPFGRPLDGPRRRTSSLRQLRYALSAAGLVLERVENIGCAVLLDPLDAFAPKLALRAAERAERSTVLRRALGMERVLVASKP